MTTETKTSTGDVHEITTLICNIYGREERYSGSFEDMLITARCFLKWWGWTWRIEKEGVTMSQSIDVPTATSAALPAQPPVTQEEINTYLRQHGQDPETLADAFRPAIEAAVRKQQQILGMLKAPVEAALPDAKPTTITAKELLDNLGQWALLKDQQKCFLVYNGDYIDGIGALSNGEIVIEAAAWGNVAEPHRNVPPDATIHIRWLTTDPQPVAEEAVGNLLAIVEASDFAAHVAGTGDDDLEGEAVAVAGDDVEKPLSIGDRLMVTEAFRLNRGKVMKDLQECSELTVSGVKSGHNGNLQISISGFVNGELLVSVDKVPLSIVRDMRKSYLDQLELTTLRHRLQLAETAAAEATRERDALRVYADDMDIEDLEIFTQGERKWMEFKGIIDVCDLPNANETVTVTITRKQAPDASEQGADA